MVVQVGNSAAPESDDDGPLVNRLRFDRQLPGLEVKLPGRGVAHQILLLRVEDDGIHVLLEEVHLLGLKVHDLEALHGVHNRQLAADGADIQHLDVRLHFCDEDGEGIVEENAVHRAGGEADQHSFRSLWAAIDSHGLH
eukprot:6916821-Prorocentrum_lima.AAC.1